jgi:hypothetical protein
MVLSAKMSIVLGDDHAHPATENTPRLATVQRLVLRNGSSAISKSKMPASLFGNAPRFTLCNTLRLSEAFPFTHTGSIDLNPKPAFWYAFQEDIFMCAFFYMAQIILIEISQQQGFNLPSKTILSELEYTSIPTSMASYIKLEKCRDVVVMLSSSRRLPPTP